MKTTLRAMLITATLLASASGSFAGIVPASLEQRGAARDGHQTERRQDDDGHRRRHHQ